MRYIIFTMMISCATVAPTVATVIRPPSPTIIPYPVDEAEEDSAHSEALALVEKAVEVDRLKKEGYFGPWPENLMEIK